MDMKDLRERAGLKTVDVASRLKKAESTVRNWDTGKTIPMIEVTEIPNLLETYGCTLEELIEAAKQSRARYESAIAS